MIKSSLENRPRPRRLWECNVRTVIECFIFFFFRVQAVRASVVEEQRKLAEERFEVASERYRLETMLKLDAGTGTDLIQARVEVKESIREMKKKEKEIETRSERAKELEKRLAEEKRRLQEQDDEIKLKSIRAEKMLKVTITFATVVMKTEFFFKT